MVQAFPAALKHNFIIKSHISFARLHNHFPIELIVFVCSLLIFRLKCE